MREAGVPGVEVVCAANFVDAPPLPAEEKDGQMVTRSSWADFRRRRVAGRWLKAFEQMPAMQLKIWVGTGSMEQELRDYISEKGIRNIELVGFKKGAEKVGDPTQRALPAVAVGVVREFSSDGSGRFLWPPSRSLPPAWAAFRTSWKKGSRGSFSKAGNSAELAQKSSVPSRSIETKRLPWVRADAA